MASKGGGETRVRVEIGAEDFPHLLECMTDADRTVSLDAMLNELKRGAESFEKEQREEIENLERRISFLDSENDSLRSDLGKIKQVFRTKVTKKKATKKKAPHKKAPKKKATKKKARRR